MFNITASFYMLTVTGSLSITPSLLPAGNVAEVTVDSLLLILGFGLLAGGAELLLKGASKIALLFGISPLVAGLTVVAFGTSSPEGAISVYSALSDQTGLALGNIIGSNTMNVLLVLGLSAAILPIVVSRQVIQLQIPLVIAVSVAFFLMSLNGNISAFNGFCLFSAIIVYTVWAIRKSRREQRVIGAETAEEIPDQEKKSRPRLFLQYGIITIAGIVALVSGARMLVQGASELAVMLGVSELIIGLTVVAFGTSLPELATFLVATIRKRRDMAVGTLIGSNLFNVLAVIGLSSLLIPGGVDIPASAIKFDIPVMTMAAIACLPIFFTGHRISRGEGFLFLGYYGLYLTYLLMSAQREVSTALFTKAVLIFIVPITILTIGISVYRHIYPPKT